MWIYPASLKLDPLPANMLSYCYFCLNINLLALVTHPVLFRFHQGLLNPFVSFSVFFRSFPFIPPLHQISPLITEVENISGYPGLFSATLFPKYLGCVSHCCTVGGNQTVCVYVIIPQVAGPRSAIGRAPDL